MVKVGFKAENYLSYGFSQRANILGAARSATFLTFYGCGQPLTSTEARICTWWLAGYLSVQDPEMNTYYFALV